MGLSWNEFVNPRAELRRREEAKQLAEQQAQNDAMAQAMGYGEQPTLSTIAAMPALPARETSFQGDGSRFGMTGTDEDYKRLFGPAAQQQPSQLHQEMQRQQGGIPQDNSPAGRMIRNMVKSGNPTVVSKGLELASQRIMNPAAAKQRRIITVGQGDYSRQYYEDDGTPVVDDAIYNQHRKPIEPEEPELTGLSSEKTKDVLAMYNNDPVIKSFAEYQITESEVKGLLEKQEAASDSAAIMKYARAMSGVGALSEADLAQASQQGGWQRQAYAWVKKQKDGTLTSRDRREIWNAVQLMGQPKRQEAYNRQSRMRPQLGTHKPETIFYRTGQIDPRGGSELDLGDAMDISAVQSPAQQGRSSAPPLLRKKADTIEDINALVDGLLAE